MLLAIDPGNIESAYVIVENDLSKVIDKGKVPNDELISIIQRAKDTYPIDRTAVEMIASYGMAVGKEVFDTCLWIGRFYQVLTETFSGEASEPLLVYRIQEKNILCHNSRARDSNIRQALIDRFGIVGTKKKPGYFYGFKKDIWAAMAVAVVLYELTKEGE